MRPDKGWCWCWRWCDDDNWATRVPPSATHWPQQALIMALPKYKIKKIIVPLLTVGKNHLGLHISDSINVVMIYPSRWQLFIYCSIRAQKGSVPVLILTVPLLPGCGLAGGDVVAGLQLGSCHCHCPVLLELQTNVRNHREGPYY